MSISCITMSRLLNRLGKALKWTVIGGLGGWLLGAALYAFVGMGTALSFPLVCAWGLALLLGICLLALAGVSLYDLAQGNTHFTWFSLHDSGGASKSPSLAVVQTPLKGSLPPTQASATLPAGTPPLSPAKRNPTVPLLPDQTPGYRPWD